MTDHISQTTAHTGPSLEVALPGRVEPDGLEVRERPVPVPGAGQALIAMAASGISSAEQAMRRGRYPGQPKFPFVPGYDIVGTVRAVGPGAAESLVGTRVAAVTKIGSWSGRRTRPTTFRRRLREDLAAVLALVSEGAVIPQVAARVPPAEVSAAIRLAESRTVLGKVVLVP